MILYVLTWIGISFYLLLTLIFFIANLKPLGFIDSLLISIAWPYAVLLYIICSIMGVDFNNLGSL